MSIFRKLFHKKEKEIAPGELGRDEGLPPVDTSGVPEFGSETPGMPPMSDMPQQEAPGGLGYPTLEQARAPPALGAHAAPSYESAGDDRNFQVINAKLDAIRANLENINQRIANLERIAAGTEEQKW